MEKINEIARAREKIFIHYVFPCLKICFSILKFVLFIHFI